MNILIAILPAFLWGVGPLIATKVGGRPINQLLGTGIGQLVVGLVLYAWFRPIITFNDFIWCFFGGFLWSIAQLMQFTSFVDLDVSTAMPISTGLQLIEIPLAGVIFWGEWGTPFDKMIGALAILLLIVGITFTSIKDKQTDRKKMNYKAGLTLLIVGAFGYTACSVFPRIPNASGIVGLLSQTIGMCVGAVILSVIMKVDNGQIKLGDMSTYKNASIGVLGGLGTLFYLISLKQNGVATSFPLTQMNVVISTIGGVVILHERKDKKEMTFTLIGLVMIIVGAFIIARI